VESFEQRRNEYFDKLKSNLEVVEKLTEDENSNNKKIVEILLMPTTEKELEFANLCFDFILNVISLVECMDSQEEKDVDLSNSMTIKLFIDVINALKNENISKIEDYKSGIDGIENPEVGAQLYYDSLVIHTSKYYNDAMDKIITETGFDPNDKLSLLQFEIYLNKACEITKQNENKNFDIENQTQFEYFIGFFKKFHELCSLGEKTQITEANKKR